MEFKNYITEVFDGAYKLLVMYNAQEKLHPKWIEKIYYSNEWMNECHRSACVCGLASSPGHSQILSRSRFSPQLRDKIWEWPGDEAICG